MASERSRRHAWWWKLPATSMAILLLYVLSYAPYLRFKYGDHDADFEVGVHYDADEPYLSECTHAFYAPVEHLIDLTQFHQPLFWWHELWSVSRKTTLDCLKRKLLRLTDEYER